MSAEPRDAEIEQSKRIIDEQAHQMYTAYSLGFALRRVSGIEAMAQTIAGSMVEQGKFSYAHVQMMRDAEGRALQIEALAGTLAAEQQLQEFPLISRGVKVGMLIVGLSDEAEMAERLNLIDFVMPTISMAVDDALTSSALADYRAALERKVEERTEELKKARDEIGENLAQLQAATAARERLFANVNHELRTPLSLIRMVAEQLPKREPQLSDRSLKDIEAVDASVHRLLRMVDELLVVAAGAEDKLVIDKRPADLVAVVTEVAGDWETTCEARGVSISLDAPERMICEIDRASIDRVLMNLLSNALKFTPKGGSIRVSLVEHDGLARLEVVDSGPGFEQEFLARVFGRFEQGRGAQPGVSRGSGIGLSLVKELAEAHAGRVSADNHPSGGARLRFEIPLLATGAVANAAPDGAAPPFAHEQIHLRPSDYGIVREERGRSIIEPPSEPEATILLAEDDFELRERAGEYLGQWFRVVLAIDGLAGVALAEQHLPDILITDIGMPGLDGRGLTRRFREMTGNRLAPVIMLTAFGTLGDRLDGFDAGAVDYVMKPFNLEELAARVRSQLRLRDLALKLSDAERVASLSVISTGLAHELRNPANAMLNALEPLRSLLPPELLEKGTPTRALLDVLALTTEQIVQVSRQLLGMRGSTADAFAEERFSDVIERATKLFMLTPRKISLTVDTACEATLWCSSTLVVQVLINLFENAANAAGAGGHVSVSVCKRAEHLVVTIADDGPGVPRELRTRIFEPFFTTRRPLGTGLGLALAREIMNRHGGDLRLLDVAPGASFELAFSLTRTAVPRPTNP